LLLYDLSIHLIKTGRRKCEMGILVGGYFFILKNKSREPGRILESGISSL
jgi:hypothetical protein